MSISIITTILTPGTCVLRGIGPNDVKSPKRWFAYFGSERDTNKFLQSKDFIRRYARFGYEYYKVTRPLPLINMPYISLVMYNDEDAVNALNNSLGMLDYLELANDPSSEVKSSAIDRYGFERVRNDLLEVLLPVMDEDFENIKDPRAMELHKLRVTIKSAHNPDHSIAKLVCDMGFMGWVRRGVSDDYYAGDEIFICDIKTAEEQEYLTRDNSCELVKNF